MTRIRKSDFIFCFNLCPRPLARLQIIQYRVNENVGRGQNRRYIAALNAVRFFLFAGAS